MMENIQSQDIKNIEWTRLPNAILINIFDYLSKCDLRQVRLVCQSWRVVTHLPEFRKKFKLVINHKNLKTIYEDLSKDKDLCKRLACETLELHGVERSDYLFLVLHSLKQHIRSLCLRSSPVFDILNECLPELEELKLIGFVFRKSSELPFLQLSKFKNLKSLDIVDNTMSNHNTCTLLRNLITIPPFQMEKLCFAVKKIADTEKLALQALKYHSHSLKHLVLSLQMNSSTDINYQWGSVFARLKYLETIQIVGANSFNFIRQLIEGIPKEAPLRSLQLIGVCILEDKILRLAIYKWAKTLETINMYSGQYITSYGFQNIGTLRRPLKRLTLSCNAYLDVSSVIEGLAVDTLESLTLMNNGGAYRQFSNDTCSSSMPKLPTKKLNNHTLQIICQHQRKLRLLALNECHNISDTDLIGIDEMQPRISNLRGLQDLTLSGGEKITDRSLVEALKFNELSKLRLDSLNKITSTGIKQLVKNCPSLERIWIQRCRMIDDDAVLYIVRGLKRLRYLNVSECQLITKTSLDHVAKYGQYLKSVHISGAEELESPKKKDLWYQSNPMDRHTTSAWL